MTTKNLLPFFFILFTWTAFSQNHISGKVFDIRSKQAVSGATISLFIGTDTAPSARTVSDLTGSFSIPITSQLPFLIQITAQGFQSQTRHYTVGQTSIDSFFLEPEIQLMQGVTVTGERPTFQRKGERMVYPIAGNLFFKTSLNTLDALRKLPGISVGGDGAILFEGRITPAIFINGKPVPMSPEELQAYLSGLNPETIASIDLIANPSARYDGEYKAIIDIRLKKDQQLGLRGNASSTLTQNDYTLSEQNLSFTYNTHKVLYLLRGSYTTGTRIHRYRARQILANNNILNTRTLTPTENNNISYQAGAEYRLSQQHKIELLFRQSLINRDISALNSLHAISPDETQTTLNTYMRNNFSPKQDNTGVNLNYTATFPHTDLQVLGTFLKIANRQQEDIQNKQTSNNSLISHWRTALKNDITIRTAQADIGHAAFDGKIIMGIRYAASSTRNDLRYDTLNQSNNFVYDEGRSNSFSYDEYISAAYLGYEGNKNDFNYSISLRTEYTRSIGNSPTTGLITKRNYLNWLPSFSISYTKNNRQYHLSFTRKMTRPNFTQLNPFRFYLSPLNYHVGNPFLLPATTNSINFAYTHKALSIRLSAGKETDPLTRYPEYDSTTHILEYLGRNLPYNHFFNTELNYSFPLTKWWKMNNTANIFYKKELTPYHDKSFSIGIWQCSLVGSQIFSLPKAFNVDISYKYLSPGGDGLYYTRPYFYIDFGIQKAWMNGRLNTRLNYYDIFNGFEVQYIFREKQLINNHLAHWFGTNRVAASVSFSFGKSTYRSKQATRGEEESRIGL